MSGDPRARLTSAIASQYGPVYVWGEGARRNRETCGGFKWIDATWITDQGIIQDGHTIWVNWQLVSNSEIVDAIARSVEVGEGGNNGSHFCTQAPESSYNIDWLALAQTALDGSYDGPELVYE